MSKKHYFSLLLLAAVGCGAHAAEPEREKTKSKYVGHVVFVTTAPPPNQASLKRVGDAFHSHLQMCVSPTVEVAYKQEEIDYSVGADNRDELKRLMDELVARGKRPLHVSFQLIATDKDYARIMGKEADPRIANSHDFGPGTEAPLAKGDERKIVKEGEVVAEWVLVGRGMAFNYMAMAHRMSGPELQVLVLNSPAPMTDEDIVEFWDQETSIIVKFGPEGTKKWQSMIPERQDRMMGVVVDGRVDFISGPGEPAAKKSKKYEVLEFYGKSRTAADGRLVTYLKMVTSPSVFKFVRSYTEDGQTGDSRGPDARLRLVERMLVAAAVDIGGDPFAQSLTESAASGLNVGVARFASGDGAVVGRRHPACIVG